MTPKELEGALFYYNLEKDNAMKMQWEMSRIQSYLLINIQLERSAKISYDDFKKDLWPFYWERPRRRPDFEDTTSSFEDWEDIINKLNTHGS